MEINRLVFLGPHSAKQVSGVGEFIKDVPREVAPAKAKSILNCWPGYFAIVMPCPECQARREAEALTPGESEPTEDPETELVPKKDAVPLKKPRKPSSPRKPKKKEEQL